MLVLTRMKDQVINFDYQGLFMRIKVIGIKGNFCTLGIDAPLDVHITRPEAVVKVRKDKDNEGLKNE